MRIDRTLFIDFEGEGRKGPDRSILPCPLLAGVYKPGLGGTSTRYEVKLLKTGLEPLKNGISQITEILELPEFVEQIILRAERENCVIVYWSEHELKVIEELTPQLVGRFKEISFNAKPEADRYLNQRNDHCREKQKKALNAHLARICPKAKPVLSPRVGAAKSCKRLEAYCSKKRSWKTWTDAQKAVARDLIAYNREDCRATYQICKKLLSGGRALKKKRQHLT